MEGLTVCGRAKINLTLDVLNRRQDGYHNVRMVMQQIELCDYIHLIPCPRQEGIRIACSHPGVPRDDNNIAYRAAQLVKDFFKIGEGIIIKIDKNIPVAAGLAGGSADAAAVIRGLNNLWGLGMDTACMMELAAKLGADVPFCLLGGTALAEGIGEILTPVNAPAKLDFLLVKPGVLVSTAWVYKNLDLGSIEERPDIEKMLQALNKGDKGEIASRLKNVLETVTASRYPEILAIKQSMIEMGALGAAMTGSGPTVFGIYRSREEAETAAGFFRERYKDIIITRSA